MNDRETTVNNEMIFNNVALWFLINLKDNGIRHLCKRPDDKLQCLSSMRTRGKCYRQIKGGKHCSPCSLCRKDKSEPDSVKAAKKPYCVLHKYPEVFSTATSLLRKHLPTQEKNNVHVLILSLVSSVGLFLSPHFSTPFPTFASVTVPTLQNLEAQI